MDGSKPVPKCLSDGDNHLPWKSHLHFEGFVCIVPLGALNGLFSSFHQPSLQTWLHFSKNCGLLGPEVISSQPGIVDLQEEVGIVNCGHQDLRVEDEGEVQNECQEHLLVDQGMGAAVRL